MNITIEKSELQNIVMMATRAVPSKSPITAMEGVLFEAVDGWLTVTGYDLRRAIYTSIEADIAETGKMLINARFLNDLLRRLQDGMVNIICNERDNRISVRCGKSEYQLSGLDTNEYPEVQKFSENQALEIPQDVLGNMIRRSLFAVAKEETRPVYTGTLFEIEGDELTLVSVDGYRLARRVEKIESSKLENSRFIVPGFALSDVEKLYKTIEDSLKELSDMKEKIKGNDMFGKFSFGLSINTKAGSNESIISFLAQSGDKTYSAGSTDELIKLISGSQSVDYRV